MSRILLVFPPSAYRNFTPPLNLAYIAGVLKAGGHDVRIIDLSAVRNPYTESDALKIAADFDPLWIGLTLNVIFIRPAYDFIGKLRVLGKPIVAGGPHPSLLAEEAVAHGCDIVVRGEGEETVIELTRVLDEGGELSGVDGITFRDPGGRPVTNPPRRLIRDLDALPFPAKDVFPREWYVEDSPEYQVYGPIFSGRGCPANCYYCYKGVFGHGCRLRSAENVFREMIHLHETYGVTAFEFLDDAFSADLDRVDELCDMILAEPGFDPVWQCTTRLDLTTRDTLKKMRAAGCFRIFYGVESGDPETLLRVNKQLDLDRAVDVLRWTREAGIRSIVGFMWGFPWDSPASVKASLRLLRRIAPYTDEFNPLGVLIPVPGTAIYETYAERYGIESWWLKDRFGARYRDNAYFPYFQRRFYNDFALLDDGFFPFPPEVKRLIRKGTSFIGRHNLFRNTPIPKAVPVYGGILLSRLLYRLNPAWERNLFETLRRVLGRRG